MAGRLIAIEGIDASGKTTQAKLLAEALGAEETFQFGATYIGSVIRKMLLDPDNDGRGRRARMHDRTEALLVMADKAQHVAEIVKPKLDEGKTVVTDRYTASTLAYQGYGRGLDLGELRRMLHFATQGIAPDLTVLLDLDPALRNEHLEPAIDRIEGPHIDGVPVASFRNRVRMGYLDMADSERGRWSVVDADGSVTKVAERVLAAVNNHRW